jgi:hypothetical protein
LLEEAATWVYENLFGADSRSSDARNLVESGRREVDMPPTDGRDNWSENDLEGRLTDIRRVGTPSSLLVKPPPLPPPPSLRPSAPSSASLNPNL